LIVLKKIKTSTFFFTVKLFQTCMHFFCSKQRKTFSKQLMG